MHAWGSALGHWARSLAADMHPLLWQAEGMCGCLATGMGPGRQLACLAPILGALPSGAGAHLQGGGHQPPVQLLHGLLRCSDGGLAPLHHLSRHPVVGAVAQRLRICLRAAATGGGTGRRRRWRRGGGWCDGGSCSYLPAPIIAGTLWSTSWRPSQRSSGGTPLVGKSITWMAARQRSDRTFCATTADADIGKCCGMRRDRRWRLHNARALPRWQASPKHCRAVHSNTGSSTAIPSSVLGWSWGRCCAHFIPNPTTVSTNTRPPVPKRGLSTAYLQRISGSRHSACNRTRQASRCAQLPTQTRPTRPTPSRSAPALRS